MQFPVCFFFEKLFIVAPFALLSVVVFAIIVYLVKRLILHISIFNGVCTYKTLKCIIRYENNQTHGCSPLV